MEDRKGILWIVRVKLIQFEVFVFILRRGFEVMKFKVVNSQK